MSVEGSDAPRVDEWYDVVVVGSGAAGCSAAIGAARAGARVVVLEESAEPGGARSAAQRCVYLGGGTATQHAAGWRDSAREMYAYLLANCCAPDREKIRAYAAGAAQHAAWLEELGWSFDAVGFSGNEQVWPFRSMAAPAPRRHDLAGHESATAPLLAWLRAHGVEVRCSTRVGRVLRGEGRVVGVECSGPHGNGAVAADAVVLATGPHGADLATRCGGAVDAASSTLVRGRFGLVDRLRTGVLVDGAGRRFVAEDSRVDRIGFYASTGEDPTAYLIVGDHAARAEDVDGVGSVDGTSAPPPVAGRWDTVEDTERALGLPLGSLAATLERYNGCARQHEDPDLHKLPGLLREHTRGPFTVYDLRVRPETYETMPLGGLRTTAHGEVRRAGGALVAGLYAAGSVAVDIVLDGENHCDGLWLGEATFFGRRAGERAARTVRARRPGREHPHATRREVR